jgi:hypothetical protein
MPLLDDYEDKLAAPCRWCGYNGPDYWQAGSHADECPWLKVGGSHERAHILEVEVIVADREAVADALEKLSKFEREARYRKRA